VLSSAIDIIVVVIMHRVVETFKSVIKDMRCGTTFKLVNLLDSENGNIISQHVTSSSEKLEN